jgi:aromatic-L-amino-acid decarboxylase
MTPDEFRALGHRMVDWIADYWSRVESMPVLSRAQPGDVLRALPAHTPERGLGADSRDSWDAVFADIERVILPGVTHWQHPSFFGYFPANISGPSVLGELLSAGLGVQGMLWLTSPACTELETRVLDWLGEAVGLPSDFLSTSASGGGVIQGTASEAALVAMVAARARARRAGAPDDALVAYCSNQAHSSIIKAAMIAGVARSPDDHAHVRQIDVGPDYAMRPDALARALREDLAAGRTPFFVCATTGTTGVTAIDRIDAIAAAIDDAVASAPPSSGAASPPRPWLHVDAAHAGAACICPEFRSGPGGWLRGIERAESFCFNPHKWLLVNFDCDCFWTRDRAALTAALSITPEYLRNQASSAGAVIDYRDWQVPLGRRFRALKLWFTLRHYGLEGLRAYVREHVRLAAVFEELVRADDRFEVVAPRTMNLVVFRLRPRAGPVGRPHAAPEPRAATDARNRALMDALNASGALFLTHTVLPPVVASPGEPTPRPDLAGALVLRMSIGAVHTQERHVRAAWDAIRAAAERL